jgi:phosphatidylglycerol:prolipoprotein diacylglycerol transferase
MLPWIHVDDLRVAGIAIHPFGLLVATAVMVGVALAKRRARQQGHDLRALDSFIGWMLFLGFVFAHVLDALLYHPRDVLARPWSLLYFWEGIGSFSGWLGALVGVVLWRRFEWRGWRLVRREKVVPILPFADIVLSVFPIAWIFGRMGCSIAHDHPGALASQSAPLAVAFPSPNPAVLEGPGEHATLGPIHVIHGHFPRYDMGTLELFFTIGLAIAFVLLWRRKLVTGTYAMLTCLAYAPVRFAMEFLRIEANDPRYGGLTPAQWMCIGLFVLGLWLLRHVRAAPRVAAQR